MKFIHHFDMNDLKAMISVAEMNPDTPSVDLHGLRVDEAEMHLESFIQALFQQGERVGRVIHGKGGDVLSRAVAIYLKKHPLVDFFTTAKSLHELGAVHYFVIGQK